MTPTERMASLPCSLTASLILHAAPQRGELLKAIALQRRSGGPRSILDETIWSLTSPCGLAQRRLGRDGSGRRAACQRSLARLLLRGPCRSVRHATGRDDFRAQNLDRRAVPHRGLSNKCKRVRLGHAVSAHDL